MVDIIIPTIPGREADLERCLKSYEQNTPGPHRVIVIEDSPSSGEGWMMGLEQSDGPYVHLSSDDVEIINPAWVNVCVEAADQGFIVAPVIYRPDRSIESCGGDMNAPDCLLTHLADDWTSVGFATTPFMSREAIDRIGMLPVHYSCDVWAAYRGRQLGYETVVRHGYELVHYQSPVGRGAGMPQGQRAAQDYRIVLDELERVGCAS